MTYSVFPGYNKHHKEIYKNKMDHIIVKEDGDKVEQIKKNEFGSITLEQLKEFYPTAVGKRYDVVVCVCVRCFIVPSPSTLNADRCRHASLLHFHSSYNSLN